MIRKTESRTTKQALFLQSLTNQLKDMDDLDPDIITHDSYEYHEANLKGIGTIPKITFKPYGKSIQIKANIIRKANIKNPTVEKEIEEIRKKHGIKTPRETENRILSRLFESYWNNYWRSIRRSLNRIEQAQKLFITNQDPNDNETISRPMHILVGNTAIVPNKENQDEKNKQSNSKKSKSYMDELMEVE